MKLRLMICVAAVSTALFATNVVTDIYGVLAVSDADMHNTVVGVPWRNVSATLADVTLSNLVSTAGLTTGDKVYLYEEASDGASVTTNWYEYVLSNAGVFEPSITVFGKTATPVAADMKTLSRGTGLIIQRATNTSPIYLCGRYDDTTSVGSTTIPANSIALIANPLTSEKSIGNTVGSDGDEIRIPLDNGGLMVYTKQDGNWGRYVETTTTSPRGRGSVTTQTWTLGCTLAAGKGAWYVCGATAATIEW